MGGNLSDEPVLERNIARDEAKADHRIVTFLEAEL